MLHNTFRDNIVTNKLVAVEDEELGHTHLNIAET